MHKHIAAGKCIHERFIARKVKSEYFVVGKERDKLIIGKYMHDHFIMAGVSANT